MKARKVRLKPREVVIVKRRIAALAPTDVLRRRLEAVLLNHRGRKSGEIASLIGMARSKTSALLKHFEKVGLKEFLLFNAKRGRPTRLSKSEEKLLEERLLKSPLETNANWTAKMVAQVIRRMFGVSYHEKYVPRLLRRLGITILPTISKA